ncbi:MAG: hypothetical protein E7A06_12250 [Clostridiales bacterium]|nr:hypothetical protein [Clostridiales bacterium]
MTNTSTPEATSTDITLTTRDLHLLLEATVPFAIKAQHECLRCVNIAINNGRLQASATDQFRASSYRLHEGDDEYQATADATFSIPLHKAKELLRITKSLRRNQSLYTAHPTAITTITINHADNTFTVHLPEGTTIAGDATEGNYPHINKLFPRGADLEKSTNSRTAFDPIKAQEIYRAAATLAKSLDTSGVLLRLPDKQGTPVSFRLQNDEHWRAILMPMRLA